MEMQAEGLPLSTKRLIVMSEDAIKRSKNLQIRFMLLSTQLKRIDSQSQQFVQHCSEFIKRQNVSTDHLP